MRKIWVYVLLLFASLIVLSACGDDDETSPETTEESDPEEETTDEASNDSEADETVEYEDQLDVEMGEVGIYDTRGIGIFEVTVNRARLIGAEEEYDGVEVRDDDLLKIEITVKNISDQTHSLDDFIGTLEVTDNLEGGGRVLYGTDLFGSLEDISGDLEPGEEKTGDRMIEVYESDEYFLRRRSGNVSAGGTNQVHIRIPVEE